MSAAIAKDINEENIDEINIDKVKFSNIKNNENISNDIQQKNIKLKSNWVEFEESDNEKPTIATKTNEISNGNVTQTNLKANTNIAATNITIKPPTVFQPVKNKLPSRNFEVTPAVLDTESVHINLNTSTTTSPPSLTTSGTFPTTNDITKNSGTRTDIAAPMRTIELSTGRIREGFANGDTIVTLLPINTKWPWITPAIFRPELVPEELMAQGLTLTVEEYVSAMETLVNDYRFTIYNICYKRVLVCWILLAFCVLLALLFSGLQGIALFSLGVGWLFLNAAAIFLCMWVKLKLARGLEKCLARVNKQLIRHKILLVLDDRGRISCHKVNLCFIYFDPAQCIAYLNNYIERNEQNGAIIQAGWERRLDVDINDIIIQGNNPVRLSRKQAIAQEIYLSYLQRWGKDYLRRRLDWTVNEEGVHEMPRHLRSSICPCQYTEEILNHKIKNDTNKKFCGLNSKFC